MKYSDLVEKIIAVQDSMLESAPSCCSASDHEALRGLIHVAVAFYYYLEDANSDDRDLIFQCEDALEATDRFRSVAAIFRSTDNNTKSAIPEYLISSASLKELYISKYQEFSTVVSFEVRIRLLLDLFRLHIIFAAINYS